MTEARESAVGQADEARAAASLAAAGRFEPLAPLSVKDGADIAQVAVGQRLRFAVPVRQPLVLISQIQRSGGTLTSQLLDGHSQLHAHPSELHIGRPNKYHWPRLDLAQPPEALFHRLHEALAVRFAREGYQKLGARKTNREDPASREMILPFIFSSQVQKAVFEKMLPAAPATQREALDAYATSYFNAWLDYRGLYRPPAKVRYWVAFAARLVASQAEIEAMFADYPDGKLIIPFRDPQSWLASALRHSDEYADAEAALQLWNAAHRASVRLYKARRNQVRLVRFEDLVGDTEACMRGVADFLGIRFEASLLVPTFNGLPILSNSSFEAVHGVDRGSLDRSGELDAPTRDLVRARTQEVYDRLCGLAARQAGASAA